MRRASSRRDDRHRTTRLEADRAAQPVERAIESIVERSRAPNAALEVQRLDDEAAVFPLGLEVGPADDAVAPEERQHVVAELPLGCRLVHLDQVVEAEDPSCERAIPEQVVEGGEQHGRGRARRVEIGAGRDEYVGVAVLDADTLEDAVVHERVDRRTDPCGAAAEPPVLDDAALGERAARANRAKRQLAQPRRLVGLGRVEHLARDDALGEVVEPLEPADPARDHDLARVPERLEHRPSPASSSTCRRRPGRRSRVTRSVRAPEPRLASRRRAPDARR